MHKRIEKLLYEVRYVSNLKKNLISLCELYNKEYVFKDEKEMLKVKTLVVIKTIKKNSLYILKGIVVFSSVFIVK